MGLTCPKRTADHRCLVAEELVELHTGRRVPVPLRDDRGCRHCLALGGGDPPTVDEPSPVVASWACGAVDGPDRQRLLDATREHRAGGPPPEDAPLDDPPPGVGTTLATLLAADRFQETADCACRRLARQLDALGPDAVEHHQPEFVRQLVANYRTLEVPPLHAAEIGLRHLPTVLGGAVRGIAPTHALAAAYLNRAIADVRQRSRIVALVPLFNPAGFRSRWENYRRAIAHFQTLGFHRVLTIEAVYPGQSPQSVGERIVIEATDLQRLWQKERLINLGLETLRGEPPWGVCWPDADLEWSTPIGPLIAHRLRACHVLQPFERVHLLGPTGEIVHTARSHAAPQRTSRPYNQADRTYAAAPSESVTRPTTSSRPHSPTRSRHAAAYPQRSLPRHCGFAWAARWSTIERGLFDASILGSGDRYMLYAWLHRPWPESPAGLQPTWRAWWPEKPLVIGALPNLEVRHHWHGWIKHRQYTERNALLNHHQFEFPRDIHLADNGLWAWTGKNPALAAAVAAHFTTRREDG